MLGQPFGFLDDFFAPCLLHDLSQDFCRTPHPGGNSAGFGSLAADYPPLQGDSRDQLGIHWPETPLSLVINV